MAKPKTKPTAADPRSGANNNPSSASSSFATLPEGAHDLTALRAALGTPDEAIRRVLYRHHDEQGFYEWGVQADSGNILADIPRFVSSALRILTALDSKRRELVMVPPQLFAVLVDEASTLETMYRGHEVVATSEATGKTDRETVLKRLSGEGVTLRNRVLGSLRSALGDARLEPLRKPSNDASTAGALARGLNAVASFIEETLKNGDDDAAALAAFQVGAPRAAELRARAAALLDASTVTASTGKRVSKRALDIQDGRVLVLVDVVYRAFRLARRGDRSILLPELNRIASLFDTRSSDGGAKETAAPVAEAGAPA